GPQRQTPPAGQIRVLPTEVFDVRGEVEGDEIGLLRDLADQRLSVVIGAQAGEGRTGIGARHPRGTVERPRDHHPVASLTGTDSIGQLPVAVLEVFEHADAEALEVEIRVAGYQRIEGPGHLRDAEVEAPQTLVQLHRRTGASADDLMADTGDVRMHDGAQ